jgi:hypothetical protein
MIHTGAYFYSPCTATTGRLVEVELKQVFCSSYNMILMRWFEIIQFVSKPTEKVTMHFSRMIRTLKEFLLGNSLLVHDQSKEKNSMPNVSTS